MRIYGVILLTAIWLGSCGDGDPVVETPVDMNTGTGEAEDTGTGEAEDVVGVASVVGRRDGGSQIRCTSRLGVAEHYFGATGLVLPASTTEQHMPLKRELPCSAGPITSNRSLLMAAERSSGCPPSTPLLLPFSPAGGDHKNHLGLLV